MGTRGAWAIDFLKQLGNSTPDEKTINLVAAWTKGENTEAKYNPLATTLDYGNNTKFNNCCGGNGVKNYASRDEGIKASIMTLRGNHRGYSTIIRGLTTNNPELALQGMKQSPWGTNFGHVESMWRGLDVRGETLLSETSTPPKIVGGTPKSTPVEWGTGGGGGGSWYDKPPTTTSAMVTGDSVRNAAKVGLGIVCAVTSVIVGIMAIARTDAAKSAINVASSVTPVGKVVKAVQ